MCDKVSNIFTKIHSRLTAHKELRSTGRTLNLVEPSRSKSHCRRRKTDLFLVFENQFDDEEIFKKQMVILENEIKISLKVDLKAFLCSHV